MNSSHCIQGCYNLTGCLSLPNCVNQYEIDLQNKLDAPMPWIGMYIAAASATCSLLMAKDVINGFRRKEIWIPCKYFSLNATTLTLLAVTMKLPVDLTCNTLGSNDKLARLSSLLLMSTAMCHIITSLGSIENYSNLVALGILVLTMAANVIVHYFQIRTLDTQTESLALEILTTSFMLSVLLYLCSSVVMVKGAKRHIEIKYNEMRKRVSNERVDELGVVVKKYWVMAATGNHQFVMARSVVSATAGWLCLTMALILVQAHARVLYHSSSRKTSSNYRWSINWIIYIQTMGVALGTIAPLCRWYVATRFKYPKAGSVSFKEEIKFVKAWISRLVEWEESSIHVQIRPHKCRVLIVAAKRYGVSFCILQFVLAGTLILYSSALFGGALLSYFHKIKNWKRSDSRSPTHTREMKSKAAPDPLDSNLYVLLLEGENQLPKKILIDMCNELDKMIEMGEKKQPKNLVEFLRKSKNFNGVREFDSFEVPSLLHSREPPNCWSLPMVTLTSIAIALPTITENEALQLLSGVTEGLSLVKLIENTSDKNEGLESICDAAYTIEWYKKWQENNLQITSTKGRTRKETLQKLSDVAEKNVNDFIAETKDNSILPVKVIAANSMYRVTQTILLAHNYEEEHQTNKKLFERLSIIISSIMAACLTNLAHVITSMCHKNGIKEGDQESVRQAAILVGQTREIFEILKQRRDNLPSMDTENGTNIDEWRANMEQDSEDPPASISASPEQNQEHACLY